MEKDFLVLLLTIILGCMLSIGIVILIIFGLSHVLNFEFSLSHPIIIWLLLFWLNMYNGNKRSE